MSSSEEERPLRPVPRHRYVDFEVAGEGAMGVVYLALDTELNRNVAFKIVRPDAAGEAPGSKPATPLEASAPTMVPGQDLRFEELRARFLQEAWVTGGMEHPGIVPVYELGQTEGGVPYYTMRFVRGQRTLETAIKELEDAPIEDRLAVLEPFLKLCDAVSYAHAQGVIHRDLKPANVALGEFGEVVLLDWGLAKLRDDGPAPVDGATTPISAGNDFRTDGTGLGTPGYMPPEAVRGTAEELDDRGDVYSLGVILFQILTGRLPFPVLPFPEYLEGVTHRDPPRAKSLHAVVPDALDRLCAEALCRDHEDRLGSVRALADGVRHWQTQSALEREMEGLLRDAKTALSAAEDAKGPSRIRQTQRALAVLAAAHKRRPEDERMRRLQTQARALHDRGIKETQRQSRRRFVLVGGVTLLALLSIAAFVVAGLLNERRKEAEDANLATNAALAEASRQREAAQRESRIAVAARKDAEREAERVRNAHELVFALVEEMQSAGRERPGQLAEVLDAGIEKALTRSADSVFSILERQKDRGVPDLLAHPAVGAATRGLPVPADLRDAEESARAATGRAQHRYLEVRRRSTSLKVRARARRALRTDQDEHDRALERILRSLEGGLDTTLPSTATLQQVQAALRPGDVLVSYGEVKDVAVAVVVQESTRRVRGLGEAGRIDGAVSELRAAWEERRPASEALARLRELIVTPLTLPPTGGRVVFVPQGATLLVPFPSLLPEREVCVVPSAGTYLHLRAEDRMRGQRVLAVTERGGDMPGARAEAEVIGDTTLLGSDATWTNLRRALSNDGPWRAVHLGVDGGSAGAGQGIARLMLTPDERDDGVLTGMEIARLDFSSSLVVLSSASLKLDPGDLAESDPEDEDGSALDVPRALLFAGARRVLFATMDAHDAATRALMVKFYDLWNPPDSSSGLDAATALKQAQAFVASHEKWRDPIYWAPWVLWGLP